MRLNTQCSRGSKQQAYQRISQQKNKHQMVRDNTVAQSAQPKTGQAHRMKVGLEPCSKTRGLSLQTDKSSIPGNTKKEKSGSSESESMRLSTTSGTSAPSPKTKKKLNQRKPPQAATSTNVEPTTSTLPKALGDHIPINTVDKVKSDKNSSKLTSISHQKNHYRSLSQA